MLATDLMRQVGELPDTTAEQGAFEEPILDEGATARVDPRGKPATRAASVWPSISCMVNARLP